MIFGFAGASVHEIVHYRIALIWHDNPELHFGSYFLPRGVDVSTLDDFPQWGVRLFAIGPTTIFVPLVMISPFLVGPPPIPMVTEDSLGSQEVMVLSYYLMVVIGAFPSPNDLFGVLNPDEFRDIAKRENPFSKGEALRHLLN